MLKKINSNWEIFNNLKQTKSEFIKLNGNNIILSLHILRDMMYFVKIWRQIRGYSSNGQRSHSNNKANKKNKSLLMFRTQQFYRLFGKKKRDIFSTLILAEYNNRLWYIMWHNSWIDAKIFIFKLAIKSKGKVKFDPQLLSKNITTGIKRVNKKKKHNAAKKKVLMVATVGLPVLFSLYLYNQNVDRNLPFRLVIPNESRRKMGKKKKK